MNIFLYGLSGSGKDTIANVLQKEFDYLKIRIAGTIKQFVFETYGFKTQEEFEKAKRSNEKIRKAHNIIGTQYDKEGEQYSSECATNNRINAIINKELLEFEIVNDAKKKPVCVVDARTIDDVKKLFAAGYYGIFLTRRSTEYADNNHKTEANIIDNGILFDYLFDEKNIINQDNFCLVFNDHNEENLSIHRDSTRLFMLGKKIGFDKENITLVMCNNDLDNMLNQIKEIIKTINNR